MPDSAIVTIINSKAGSPSRATVDGVSIDTRPLTELIAADKYLSSKQSVTNPAGCLTRVKIIQPGMVGNAPE